MGLHPLFTLSSRLQLCASMVRSNTKLADIGTDHAYLPIWLVKKGLIIQAVAADIKSGPLEKAKQNISRYHVQNIVKACLSDGLNEISPIEADDIVIAGMGGEMIIKIIDETQWLKDKNKRLILQPMTMAHKLRVYLAEQDYEVLKEEAAIEDNHVYSVILARYNPKSVNTNELYQYIGKLDLKSEASREYIRLLTENFKKKAGGLVISGKKEEADELYNVVEKINAKILER